MTTTQDKHGRSHPVPLYLPVIDGCKPLLRHPKMAILKLYRLSARPPVPWRRSISGLANVWPIGRQKPGNNLANLDDVAGFDPAAMPRYASVMQPVSPPVTRSPTGTMTRIEPQNGWRAGQATPLRRHRHASPESAPPNRQECFHGPCEIAVAVSTSETWPHGTT